MSLDYREIFIIIGLHPYVNLRAADILTDRSTNAQQRQANILSEFAQEFLVGADQLLFVYGRIDLSK
jgi:hypothetical protein